MDIAKGIDVDAFGDSQVAHLVSLLLNKIVWDAVKASHPQSWEEVRVYIEL